jgi:Methylase involved in ubiquinone/menaquinone biosynthesis
MHDNRKYDYAAGYSENRSEYDIIATLITPGATVIDLGCGNGNLLELLKKEKNIKEKGIELSESGINICKQKKLDVIQGSIDVRLPFNDNEFDFSVCNVTIQMVNYPEVLISEMKRISKYQIVSFPNFGFYKNRIELLIKGRMPKSMLFGYKWYSTGHIHQFSVKDFTELLNDIGGLNVISVQHEKINGKFKNILTDTFPNLFQYIPIYFLSK